LIAFMGIRTVQEQGIHLALFYFMLFLAAHLIIAAVGIVLMRGVPNLATAGGSSSDRSRRQHMVDQSRQGIWLRLRPEVCPVDCP
jgi:hypothetical protein